VHTGACVSLGAAFEAALEQREIALVDLFDEQYREIPGSNPKQFLARFTELCDAVGTGEAETASMRAFPVRFNCGRGGAQPDRSAHDRGIETAAQHEYRAAARQIRHRVESGDK
jgi:hypothetical protein